MQRVTVGRLRNLLAATKAIGHDHAAESRLADFRQQHALAYRHGNVIFIFFEAERTRHAAATRRRVAGLDAHLLHDVLFIVNFEERLVMAMAMHYGGHVQLRGHVLLSLLVEELAQQECLLTELLCVLALRE